MVVGESLRSGRRTEEKDERGRRRLERLEHRRSRTKTREEGTTERGDIEAYQTEAETAIAGGEGSGPSVSVTEWRDYTDGMRNETSNGSGGRYREKC